MRYRIKQKRLVKSSANANKSLLLKVKLLCRKWGASFNFSNGWFRIKTSIAEDMWYVDNLDLEELAYFLFRNGDNVAKHFVWKKVDDEDWNDLKYILYPCERFYIVYREYKSAAFMTIYVDDYPRDYKLPIPIFRKVLDDMLEYISEKTNVKIPKLNLTKVTAVNAGPQLKIEDSHLKVGDVIKYGIPCWPWCRFFKIVEITKVWKSDFGKTFTNCLCEELGKYKRNEGIFKNTFSDSDNWKVSEEEANNYLPKR